MATLLEQIANIQDLIDKLEAIGFGDENTNVSFGGLSRGSVSKQIKDKFSAVAAMVQGRIAFELKSEMIAAGAPSNSELAEVWNDPVYENNGVYGWDGSAWVRSSFDAADLAPSPNILFSPFFEFFEKYGSSIDDVLYITGNGSFSDSVVSPYYRKVLKIPSENTGVIDRRVYIDQLGVKAGDRLRIRFIANFENTNGQFYAYCRDSTGTVIGQAAKISESSGLSDEVVTIVVPDETTRIDLRVFNPVNAGSVEFIASAIAVGTGTPTLSVYEIPDSLADYVFRLSSPPQFNACPDPVFNSWAAGINTLDGINIMPSTVTPVIFSGNPFTGYAALIDGIGSVDKKIPKSALPVRLGDTITIIVGVYASESVKLGAYWRDSENSVIGSISQVTQEFDSAGEYQEIAITRPVDSAVMSDAVRIDVRVQASDGTFSEPTYWCATAVYIGDVTDSAIFIQTTAIDKQLQELKSEVSAINQTAYEWVEGAELLREFHQRTRSALIDSGTCSVALIGDSWTHLRGRYSQATAKHLQSVYGKAGIGWVSFSGHSSSPVSLANMNVIGGTAFEWSALGGSDIGGWTFNYYTASSPDLASVTSSTAGDIFTAVLPTEFSAADLCFVGTSDGVVKYSWDGGATWQADTPVQGSGFNTVAMSGVPAFNESGTCEFIIEVVSGTVELCGMNAKHPSGSGVILHKLGATGGKASNFNGVNQSDWQSSLVSLAVNTAIIMLGTNDQASRTVQQFKSDIQQLVQNIRTARPMCDIAIVMPCENQRVNSVLMADMSIAAREVARIEGCAFMDLQAVFGDDPADYAYGSDRPWFASDLIHPDPATGGRAIVDAVIKFLGA